MDNILNFIGTESGFGNNNNSAYIEIDNEFILIDCGFTVFKQLKEKIDFKKYNKINVIITHLHNDHCGSLSQLILYLWFIYGKKTNIITKCKNIKTYLEITGTTEEAYEITDRYKDLIFIKTEHVKELDCYGFRIKIKDRDIVYTGDTKNFDSFLEYMNGVTDLYIDVSKNGGVHIKFEEIIPLLTKIKRNGTNIYLMHIDDYEYINKLNNGQFNFA